MRLDLFPFLALLWLSNAAPTETDSTLSPDPSLVKISMLTASGTGCPKEYTTAHIPSDSGSVYLLIEEHPGQYELQYRKSCQISLSITFPPSWQYSITKTTFSGTENLDEYMTKTQRAIYRFSNDGESIKTNATLNGPLKGNYKIEGQANATVWSPCGGPAQLVVQGSMGLTYNHSPLPGVLAVEPPATLTVWNTGIVWKKCEDAM
ncbi:hypothetical protein BGZ60DRAFT_518184 [Tricladium varicosporioides]|nr:hypothetical protein BGZ60DRAFT_518184 [Hymenoscyphus varicosporioides]